MKANTIGEYFGTLQQSVIISWRKHLKASKNSVHEILNDFYDDMLDDVDALIESYMAQNGKVDGYDNLFDDTANMEPIEYVKAIYDFAKENKELLGDDSEILSALDDVLNVCDTAIYKLRELTEEDEEEDFEESDEEIEEDFEESALTKFLKESML